MGTLQNSNAVKQDKPEKPYLSQVTFREDRWYLPDEPLLGFVEIPAGRFWMGSEDNDAYDDEKPRHELDLPTFYMARYPVTVAQFKVFVEQSGYEYYPDCLKGLPSHPVVWETWYEAMKYCRWLDEKLHDEECVPEPLRTVLKGNPSLHATLPTEAEWEKAARGTDGRKYPWGEEFDSQKANTGEAEIGGTNAVGCFTDGASPYGLLDMSGNVWEWTRSLLYFDYPYSKKLEEREDLDAERETARVVRGGAFSSVPRITRCTYRVRGIPFDRIDDFGFRVALSPFPYEL
jgi:formylglycine-generating enzyme required for sulfatase activity